MAQNITLLGADYPDVPSVELPKTGGGTASFTDTTDTTATAADTKSGKLLHLADGSLATGTLALKPAVLRPDAEKIQTWSYDKLIVEDEGIAVKSYTTTASTLKAAALLSPTIPCDAAYDYLVAMRGICYPIYNSGTSIAKGRVEFFVMSNFQEITQIPKNTAKAANGTYYASVSRATSAVQHNNRLLYWSSATGMGFTNAQYGVYMAASSSTTITSSAINVYSPALMERGSTSYFVNTFMNAVSDIRYQWIIDVWRVPKGSWSVDGWCHGSQLATLAAQASTSSRTLS